MYGICEEWFLAGWMGKICAESPWNHILVCFSIRIDILLFYNDKWSDSADSDRIKIDNFVQTNIEHEKSRTKKKSSNVSYDCIRVGLTLYMKKKWLSSMTCTARNVPQSVHIEKKNSIAMQSYVGSWHSPTARDLAIIANRWGYSSVWADALIPSTMHSQFFGIALRNVRSALGPW